MTDLDASYCPVCGNILATAQAIHADDGEPFSPEACGEFEQAGAHAVVRPQEVRVYVHGDTEEIATDGGIPNVDEVVINASGANGVSRSFHLPGDGDEPLCSLAERGDMEWLRKDSAVYPASHFEWCQRCLDKADGREVATDGGTITADPDPPALPQVIADVLDDATGGIDRQILIERVAELSGATIEEAEEALGGEIRHGRAIVVDGEIRKTPNRRFAGGGRR